MGYGAPLPRRRDAQRNRAAIVRAAVEALAAPEPTVEMAAVARRAGLGLATVYRHFPDRQALVFAVLTQEIARVDADCPTGFRGLLADVLRTQVHARRGDPASRERFAGRMVVALTGPLRRAQERGHVRADLAPGDLRLLFRMVDGVLGSVDDPRAARAAAGRSIDLMLDGLMTDRVGRSSDSSGGDGDRV